MVSHEIGVGSRYEGREPAQQIVTRGAWLVLLELTAVRVAWTFNFDFGSYLLAGVLWVIGWCMILMSVLVRLPVRVLGALGVAIVAGHNLVDPWMPQLIDRLPESSAAGIWKILYFGFFVGPVSFSPDGPHLMVLYSIVPWIGVMAAGYAFGTIMSGDAERCRRLCLAIGLGAIALFLILRGFNLYGDPRP